MYASNAFTMEKCQHEEMDTIGSIIGTVSMYLLLLITRIISYQFELSYPSTFGDTIGSLSYTLD
jgi:hypothetical protein